MMCCTLSSASTLDAKQSATLHKQVATLHQFPPTLPIIWAQVAVKRFLHNSRWCPFKIKKGRPAPLHQSKTCPMLAILTHRCFRWTIPLNERILIQSWKEWQYVIFIESRHRYSCQTLSIEQVLLKSFYNDDVSFFFL
jgi:hypothetical protein